MEGVFKADDRRALGIATRDLDGVFDGLGAAVDEQGLLGKIAGDERIQLFRQGDVIGIWRDAETGVQKAIKLGENSGNDAGGAIADVQAADATGKIEKAIAIHVFEERALSPRDKYRRGVIDAPRNGGGATAHQLLGTRTGNGGAQFDYGHVSTIQSAVR